MKMDARYDLEDLSILLECAVDNLDILYDALEPQTNSCPPAYDALHSFRVQLRIISNAIQERVSALPLELVRRQPT